MSEVYETHCHVWDEDSQTPEDDLFSCPTFFIHVQAIFTASSYGNENEDEDDMPCFIETRSGSLVREKTHEVLVRNLVHDYNNNNNSISSSVRVRDMLLSMDVPVQDFIVDRILACAYRMGVIDERYRNRKVLRMRVNIEAVMDELPDLSDVDDDDDEEEEEEEEDEEEDEEENYHSMMNDNECSETAAALIKKLRKVPVESPNNCCPICLEDFLVGTEATSLPTCSHLFHRICIVRWLNKKKLCPFCRSELS